MNKLTIATLLAFFTLTACQQKTERVVSPTETTETTTVSTATVDTAAAAETATEAAHETGTALETAGKELQEEAKTDTK